MVSGAYRNQITVFGLLGPSLIRAIAAADAARATRAHRGHTAVLFYSWDHMCSGVCAMMYPRSVCVIHSRNVTVSLQRLLYVPLYFSQYPGA